MTFYADNSILANIPGDPDRSRWKTLPLQCRCEVIAESNRVLVAKHPTRPEVCFEPVGQATGGTLAVVPSV